MKNITSIANIETKIFSLNGKQVMIDRDLAELYEVKPIRLREQVKRNKDRFPNDFMFQLTTNQKNELIANCDRFKTLKHSNFNPYAFTQEGVAMLSGVLRSDRAIKVNIAIMRAFVSMRSILLEYKEFSYKLKEIDRKILSHDKNIITLFDVIKQLMAPPSQSPKPKIGFDG